MAKSRTRKWIANASFFASALLFLVALFTGSVTVRTTQPSGLAEISDPYSAISFFTFLASTGVLLFGFALSYANLSGRPKERRRLSGSLALSGGILAILVAVFVYVVNVEDEGPRCLGGCAPSLLQYYQEVYGSMTILAIIGLIAIGFGIRLLLRKENPTKARNVIHARQ